ncbi:MAG: hypothetical protein QNJ77_13425 [Acidimicrobiia bacterium]|nr:hypothetical protein [Acidimicrobiia bacterium]
MTSIDVMHGVLLLFLPLGAYLVDQNRRMGFAFDPATIRAFAVLALGIIAVASVILRILGIYDPSP